METGEKCSCVEVNPLGARDDAASAPGPPTQSHIETAENLGAYARLLI